MLSLHTYISAIYDMGLSYSDLSAIFSVSNGTISNWINGNTKTKYRVKADKIIFGTMGCIQEKKLLPDSFIKALVELVLLADGSITGTGDLGSIKLEALTGAKAIATGRMHAVGLMENGCVVNTGTDIDNLSDVERWHNMIAIAAGYSITIGVRIDGRVLVTHDKHSYFYLNTDEWKLFEDNKSEKLISQFDKALEKYKQVLSSIKKQALTVSPYISEYHNNVKFLDFSHFQEKYKNLNSLFTASFQMNQEYPSFPTIQNLTSTLLNAFIDVKDTIKETDGRYYITNDTYQAFVNFTSVINQLERKVRLIEGELHFQSL